MRKEAQRREMLWVRFQKTVSVRVGSGTPAWWRKPADYLGSSPHAITASIC